MAAFALAVGGTCHQLSLSSGVYSEFSSKGLEYDGGKL